MKVTHLSTAIAAGLAAILAMPVPAGAQASSVAYGRVTAIQPGPANSGSSRNTGAVVGGMVGMASGSGQRGANRAARTAAGAAAGNAIGNSGSSSSTGNFFTVRLVGGGEVRVLSDQRDIRVDDCVSVDRDIVRRVDNASCGR